MKKTFLALFSAALLFVGCAEERPGQETGGEMVDVSISATTKAMQSKAAIDSDGAAANVTRWIMEVRDVSGEVYSRKVQTAAAGTLQQTFNVRLFKNQKYVFAFWADNGDVYYDASDLSAIKYKDNQSVVANVDAKDAFSAAEEHTFTETAAYTVTLHRPFAQMNVITTDLDALYKDAISQEKYNAFEPKNFKATITVPTTFNVLTGEAGDETELILSAAEFYGKDAQGYEAHPEKGTMFMAYIFASQDDKDLRDIYYKFDVDSQTGLNEYSFTSVPFQRNYRTNILGNFLSGEATWTVEIDKNWDGEYDYPPFETGSIAEANASLANGETNISISNPSTDCAGVALTMPAAVNGKDVIVALGEDVPALKVVCAEGAEGPKSLSLAAGTTETLDVVAPDTHVELNKGSFTTVNAATSSNTLVVGKYVTIQTLNVKQGNVAIEGNVTAINREGGLSLVWTVASSAQLANAIKFIAEGESIEIVPGTYDMPTAIKTNNISISGSDGVVLNCPATCNITSDNIVLRDLTVKCNPDNGSTSGTWAVSKNAKLENCVFTENSKYIVNVSGTGTVDFNDCRFENAGKGRGIMIWGGSPTINVDGCYFDNVYPFNVDSGNPTFAFTNSILNGWCSWGKGTVSFEDCEFGESTSGYAYCRPYQNIVFTDCNFCEGYNVDFGAAGVEIDMNGCKLNGQPMSIKILDLFDLSNAGVLRIDGSEVFPVSTFEVATAAELKGAINCVNNLKKAGEYSIILADGTYEVSDMIVAQNFAGKSVIIKAANSKAAVLKLNAETKTKQIFLIHGGSNYDETRAITFDGIKFELPGSIVGNASAGAIYAMQQSDPLCDVIKWPKNNETRYAHNVTAINCELTGKSGKKVSDSDNDNTALFYSQSATDAKNIKAVNCVIKNAGYLANIYASGVEAVNCTVTNCKDFINNQTSGITVNGGTVECTSDYAIRTNGGPVSVTGTEFNMTWTGAATDAAVIVLRGSSAPLEATVTGCTITKADEKMSDVYCKTAWSVNGESQAAGAMINF